MSDRPVLCKLADFDEEYPIVRAEVPGFPPLAVYRVGAEVYCTDDTCSHGQASLSEGDLEDHTVICPFHGGEFDVRTGEATGRPCFLAIGSYPVAVEGDEVVLLAPVPADG
ncbi:non-heme iron oxygenase ferredoxin subunit [Pseudonocardia acaciae]|uniref:non-heme iron oxygenase ferredoxin subunit n=1 Tax=Pseudonocardia acaciae TaxID=551276 RepID=UPI0005670748|nr:non-heme iron oxygenase ferredoxin subunit [Pseudonocardia acaciae]